MSWCCTQGSLFSTDLGHLREVWIELGAAQPLCRRDHSAVIHNNIMYIYGGFVDSAGANQELWAFNIGETVRAHLRCTQNSDVIFGGEGG